MPTALLRVAAECIMVLRGLRCDAKTVDSFRAVYRVS
jgi:hypothetical protein